MYQNNIYRKKCWVNHYNAELPKTLIHKEIQQPKQVNATHKPLINEEIEQMNKLPESP